MSVPEIVLDDLNWQDMVETVRAQIAAASAEEWTLHGPIDPGVTLLEFFAYSLEQRVYWLDQISDPLILAMLALLGEQPHAARAATTVMELHSEGDNVVDVMPHTDLRRSENEAIIHFRTLSGLPVLPIERLVVTSLHGVRDARRDDPGRWSLRPLTLLPADGKAAEFRCDFWFRGGPGSNGTTLNILVEIDAPPVIAPEWSHESVHPVAPPAKLRWQYRNGQNRTTLPETAVRDGTQGLRRSGLITIDIPDDWEAAGSEENGLRPYALWASVDASTFSVPPQLLRMTPNVTIAAHECARSLSAGEIEGQLERWLPLPGMTLQLNDPSPPLEESVDLRIRERDGCWHEWKHTTDLGQHGPGDRVFIVDRSRRRLEFGDGLTARIPVPDSNAGSSLSLDYLAGGGAAGNIGAYLDWQIPAHVGLRAINPLPASGGAETETAAAARGRAAAALLARERAVTAGDFETLALNTPGIALARAHAAVGYHPAFPCDHVPGAVTVFIVPEVPRSISAKPERWVAYPQPDPGAVAEVLARLAERRLVTTEVFVRGPVYRRVDVKAILSGDEMTAQALRGRIAEELESYLDPLTGGEEGGGWPFGHAVRPTEFAYIIDTIAGVEALVTDLTLTLDGDGPSSDCEDLPIRDHELVCLGELALEWRTAKPRRGGLR